MSRSGPGLQPPQQRAASAAATVALQRNATTASNAETVAIFTPRRFPIPPIRQVARVTVAQAMAREDLNAEIAKETAADRAAWDENKRRQDLIAQQGERVASGAGAGAGAGPATRSKSSASQSGRAVRARSEAAARSVALTPQEAKDEEEDNAPVETAGSPITLEDLDVDDDGDSVMSGKEEEAPHRQESAATHVLPSFSVLQERAPTVGLRADAQPIEQALQNAPTQRLIDVRVEPIQRAATAPALAWRERGLNESPQQYAETAKSFMLPYPSVETIERGDIKAGLTTKRQRIDGSGRSVSRSSVAEIPADLLTTVLVKVADAMQTGDFKADVFQWIRDTIGPSLAESLSISAARQQSVAQAASDAVAKVERKASARLETEAKKLERRSTEKVTKLRDAYEEKLVKAGSAVAGLEKQVLFLQTEVQTQQALAAPAAAADSHVRTLNQTISNLSAEIKKRDDALLAKETALSKLKSDLLSAEMKVVAAKSEVEDAKTGAAFQVDQANKNLDAVAEEADQAKATLEATQKQLAAAQAEAKAAKQETELVRQASSASQLQLVQQVQNAREREVAQQETKQSEMLRRGSTLIIDASAGATDNATAFVKRSSSRVSDDLSMAVVKRSATQGAELAQKLGVVPYVQPTPLDVTEGRAVIVPVNAMSELADLLEYQDDQIKTLQEQNKELMVVNDQLARTRSQIGAGAGAAAGSEMTRTKSFAVTVLPALDVAATVARASAIDLRSKSADSKTIARTLSFKAAGDAKAPSSEAKQGGDNLVLLDVADVQDHITRQLTRLTVAMVQKQQEAVGEVQSAAAVKEAQLRDEKEDLNRQAALADAKAASEKKRAEEAEAARKKAVEAEEKERDEIIQIQARLDARTKEIKDAQLARQVEADNLQLQLQKAQRERDALGATALSAVRVEDLAAAVEGTDKEAGRQIIKRSFTRSGRWIEARDGEEKNAIEEAERKAVVVYDALFADRAKLKETALATPDTVDKLQKGERDRVQVQVLTYLSRDLLSALGLAVSEWSRALAVIKSQTNIADRLRVSLDTLSSTEMVVPEAWRQQAVAVPRRIPMVTVSRARQALEEILTRETEDDYKKAQPERKRPLTIKMEAFEEGTQLIQSTQSILVEMMSELKLDDEDEPRALLEFVSKRAGDIADFGEKVVTRFTQQIASPIAAAAGDSKEPVVVDNKLLRTITDAATRATAEAKVPRRLTSDDMRMQIVPFKGSAGGAGAASALSLTTQRADMDTIMTRLNDKMQALALKGGVSGRPRMHVSRIPAADEEEEEEEEHLYLLENFYTPRPDCDVKQVAETCAWIGCGQWDIAELAAAASLTTNSPRLRWGGLPTDVSEAYIIHSRILPFVAVAAALRGKRDNAILAELKKPSPGRLRNAGALLMYLASTTAAVTLAFEQAAAANVFPDVRVGRINLDDAVPLSVLEMTETLVELEATAFAAMASRDRFKKTGEPDDLLDSAVHLATVTLNLERILDCPENDEYEYVPMLCAKWCNVFDKWSKLVLGAPPGVFEDWEIELAKQSPSKIVKWTHCETNQAVLAVVAMMDLCHELQST